MRFEAYDHSLETIRILRSIAARLRSRDPDLLRQIRKAASSVPLNLAEGAGRRGKDRLHHYRIAEGSARELRAAVHVALAWGDAEEQETRRALEPLDRLVRLIWGLTH